MGSRSEENNFNLTEKYAAYDPQNQFHTNDVNRLRFLLFTKLSENKLRKYPPTREALQPSYFTFSVHGGLNMRWRFDVDWCRAYDVNLNDQYLPALAKDFTHDENVWRKKCHDLLFVDALVLQRGKIPLNSLFIHLERCVYNLVEHLRWIFFAKIVNS